jgi:hypothetical protein
MVASDEFGRTGWKLFLPGENKDNHLFFSGYWSSDRVTNTESSLLDIDYAYSFIVKFGKYRHRRKWPYDLFPTQKLCRV